MSRSGFQTQVVTVISVDIASKKAVVVNGLGVEREVRLDVLPTRYQVPAEGEVWIIDMSLGTWSFVGIMNPPGGTPPDVAALQASVASLQATVASLLAGPGVATTAARSDIVPIGMPLPWLTITAPAGYLMLDGSTASRTTYPALHVLMRDAAGPGTYPWGPGDGTTTFGLPDCRGKTPIGVGTGTGLTVRALGAYLGTETHALTLAQLASHDHGNTTDESAQHTHTPATGTYGQSPIFGNESSGLGGGAVGPGGRGTPAGSVDSNGHVHGTSVVGSGAAHNNMQPSIAWNWIIRAL